MTIYIHTDEQLEALCKEHGASDFDSLATALLKQYILLIDDRPHSEYYGVEAQASEENFDQFCHVSE